MTIWKKPISLDLLNALSKGNSGEHVGIEFTDIGDNYVTARIPVDHKTMQPWGSINGGMNVVLAETVASYAAYYAIESGFRCVGLDINANHIAPAKRGWVTATACPIQLGNSIHVWAIDLKNDAGKLTCVARLTLCILKDKRQHNLHS
jgi:1,4-dihydroxy-2-naphthoyl-CoA hydrolase